jgi:hypothetical protein
MQRQPRGQVQAVGLVILDRREVRLALVNDDVAGGTGAVAAAGMLEGDAEIQRYVEDRSGFSVALVGKALELHRHVAREEGYPGHRNRL